MLKSISVASLLIFSLSLPSSHVGADSLNLTATSPGFISASSSISAKLLNAGAFHNCIVSSTQKLLCWGRNDVGQLGDGTTTDRLQPIEISSLGDVELSVNSESYSCAVLVNKTVKCWGDNTYGQLGNGTTISSSIPVQVSNLQDVKDLALGGTSTCALTLSGGVKCWGANFFGQLGNDSTSTSLVPVDVKGLTSGVQDISASGRHTCAVNATGGVQCWGYNLEGMLGDGTTVQRKVPTNVVGLTSGVKSVALGYYYSCALLINGTVKCWGDNPYGQLGDGTKTDRLTPVTVSDITNAKYLSAGWFHTCALLTNGEARCWGSNDALQIGDQTTINRTTPTAVKDLSSDNQIITTGYFHTCVMTSNGKVRCFGGNGYGQLGDGTTSFRLGVVDVISITGQSFPILMPLLQK